MSIRLRKSTPEVNSSVSASSVTVTETVTDTVRTDVVAPVTTMGAPVTQTTHFMARNYLWVYLMLAVIVLVIIIWYASTGCRANEFDRLHVKGVEWIRGSSGRTIMALFLAVALLLLAWSFSSVSGMYRCAGDMNKSNILMGAFGLMLLLVLITFILFYNGSFTTAYYFALFTLLLAVLVTVMFAYYRFSGAALALGLFALFALMATWVIHRISCQNPSRCRKGSGSGGSGSGSASSGSGSGGSPHSSPRGSPYSSPHH